MPKEPAGAGGVVSIQFIDGRSAFDVTVDIMRGAAEAAPDADFRISTDIKGDGIVVVAGCPIADAKAVSEDGGSARVIQSVPYNGPGGTFVVAVTTQVLKTENPIGSPATGSFTVVVPAR